MTRKHSRRRQRGYGVLGWLGKNFGALRAHPLRAALLGVVGLALAWLTLTKSLPFALAPSAPDLALALNARNPEALMAKARQTRDRMLAQTGSTQDPNEPGAFSQRINTLENLPKANGGGGMEDLGGKGEAMRKEIQQLAIRTLAADPLNAEAYELLGFVSNEPERTRVLMKEAINLSRRESSALFWLLNDSFLRKDYRATLDYADLLLKTRPELSVYATKYIALTAEDAEGLPLVADVLTKKPSWRRQFFGSYSQSETLTEVPLKLMISLKENGAPPSPKELAPYLDALIARNRIDVAYNAWLQFLPEEQLSNLGLLTNANFETPPSGLPFDWRMEPGLNAVAEFVGRTPEGSGRLLHVTFGPGRVKFPELSQLLFLAPGHYRLEGKLRGTITAKRGLRWQLTCATGSRRALAETDMLMGETEQWRIFTLEGDVPQSEDCNGQALRLFHDSRSASEELISGEVWFGSLRLSRIQRESKVAE